MPQTILPMSMTPQEMNIYRHHLANLRNSNGRFIHPNGAVSTVYQMSVEGPGSRFYNIPTVWNGKILPAKQALAKALSDGRGWQYWPSYPKAEAPLPPEQNAEDRYGQMHVLMDQETANYMGGQ